MNINLLLKKCSGQSRYARCGSDATAIYGHKMPFFKHLSSQVQGLHWISKSYNLHWTEYVQTISFTASFILIGLIAASGKVATGILRQNDVEKIRQTSYISKTVPLAVFTQSYWYGYRWNRHFMLFSKMKVVFVINEFGFSPRHRYVWTQLVNVWVE